MGHSGLNGFSRIFAKIGQCRDKHKTQVRAFGWKRPQNSWSAFGQGENLCCLIPTCILSSSNDALSRLGKEESHVLWGVSERGGVWLCGIGRRTELGHERDYWDLLRTQLSCPSKLKTVPIFRFHIPGTPSVWGKPEPLVTVDITDIEDKNL